MPSASSARLSFLRIAWCHLTSEWESSVGVALALLLALLPAGLVLVDRSAARSDLDAVIGASGSLTVERAGVTDPQAFDAFQRQVRIQVGPRLGQYMDDGSARAVAAPFRIVSIASRQPAGPAATAEVGVAYVSDLRIRVEVVQGLFPKPGAAPGERMATMPQALADRVGVQLFDVVCVDVSSAPPASSSWCARIVGLWRPAAGADPAWTAANARAELFVPRDDLFAAAALLPPRSVLPSRRYGPRVGGVTPQNASVVAQRVRDARTAVAASGAGQMSTSLDTALSHYASTSVTSLPVELVAAALVPLLTLLAVVMARWYVEPRLRELALLRARGWSGPRVRRLVLAELALLGMPAFVVAVVGLLAVVWQASDGAIGTRPVSLSAGELLAIVVAATVLLVAAVRFADLARWASRQSVLRLDAAETPSSGLRAGAAGLLVVPAVLLLVLPRLAGSQGWRLPGWLDDLGALVISVAGLVMLVLAALPVTSLVAGVMAGRRGTLEGSMAQVQLRSWWQRNPGAGCLVVLAFAVASYAAVSLVDQVLSGPGGTLGQGIAASLAIGFVSALATALLAYGLVFLAMCRLRTDYYTALMVDGLPANTVRRSVDIEQRAVLNLGILVGLVMGMVLVLATASGVGLAGQAGAVATAPHPAAVIAGLVATVAIGVLAGRTVAWLVRQNVVAFRLVERSWRAT